MQCQTPIILDFYTFRKIRMLEHFSRTKLIRSVYLEQMQQMKKANEKFCIEFSQKNQSEKLQIGLAITRR